VTVECMTHGAVRNCWAFNSRSSQRFEVTL